MIIYQDKLISCAYDKTIKIWDLNMNLNMKGKDTNLLKL